MGYIEGLSSVQIENVKVIIKEGKKEGLSVESISSMIAIASKECELIPRTEKGYSGTSNTRIRSIFSKLKSMSDSELTLLKKSDKKFFDAIYGGMYGNAKDEGYKYRGRFFNQLTFKGNYKQMSGKTGIDLVTDPEKYNNDVIVSTKVMFAYFKSRVDSAPSSIRRLYATHDLKTVLTKYYHANAGWGKSAAAISSDTTGGLKKVRSRIDSIHAMVISELNKKAPIK